MALGAADAIRHAMVPLRLFDHELHAPRDTQQNLRAAGEMVLGASVLIDARVLLAGSPAVPFVISSFLSSACLWHVVNRLPPPVV
jgi:hypothetical protein